MEIECSSGLKGRQKTEAGNQHLSSVFRIKLPKMEPFTTFEALLIVNSDLLQGNPSEDRNTFEHEVRLHKTILCATGRQVYHTNPF